MIKSALKNLPGKWKNRATPAEAGPAPPSVTPVPGTPRSHDIQVVRRVAGDRWAWIECLRDADPHFVTRNFLPRQEHARAEVVAAFGTSTPSSGDVLLHHGGDPPPGVRRRPIPVLLVHGAGTDGGFFVDPARDGSRPGLAQHLRGQGFLVYAVTFAHNQDDNYFWAQQLANAILRVRTLTNADQVDVVAHSKGCVPTRMLLSDFREDWMTGFRRDVRRAVFIASPFGGLDYLFRHPSANIALFLTRKSDDRRLNAPMSWESLSLCALPLKQDVRDMSLSQDGLDYWPGQRQLLARWDERYPLPVLEVDAATTYGGGQGLVGGSKGIDHYIHQGGDFMQRLQDTPIDGQVEIAILAGDRANVKGILNENTGPSDGLLYVASAVKVPKRARVLALEVLPLNHVELAVDARACRWVSDVLAEASSDATADGEEADLADEMPGRILLHK